MSEINPLNPNPTTLGVSPVPKLEGGSPLSLLGVAEVERAQIAAIIPAVPEFNTSPWNRLDVYKMALASPGLVAVPFDTTEEYLKAVRKAADDALAYAEGK